MPTRETLAGYNQVIRHGIFLTLPSTSPSPSPLFPPPQPSVAFLQPVGYVDMIRALNSSMIRGMLECVNVLLFLSFVILACSLKADEPIRNVSWMNEVMPVLTKAGCNAGVCHAKAGGGQNGFQLSLLGFEPVEDYEHLVKEGRGRRLFPGAPDKSLLLLKSSGQLPHGGGVRLPFESDGYVVLREWIRQGMPFDASHHPMTSLAVSPSSGVMAKFGQQKLRVMASYSDGSQRDVTQWALFESNDKAMAEVDSVGLVKASNIPGNVAIMVRFMGSVAVYNASIPHGSPIDRMPVSKSFIDEHIFENLSKLGIPPSELCDDATFIRRVSLDVAGRLPSEKEVLQFVASEDLQKRERWVEHLLTSSEYADFFANKWTALLKNRRDDASDITSNFAFYSWMRDSLLANKPYDQLTRELLAATGTVMTNPPVAWYKRVKEPKQQLEDVAQLFLGVRMQCAQCHHHPFEKWSQDDYYGLAAFFSQVGRKPTATRGEDMIFHKRGIAQAVNIKTGSTLRPKVLGEKTPEIAPDQDPRLKLADWMSSEDNPFFAKAVVNRYWKHFFRRGLIEPEDDIRDSNPASNPQLLAALEKHFVEGGFDLKELVRVIVNSQAYQLSSVPNSDNVSDQQNYSRYYPRRLPAEVLLDSMDDVMLTRTDFPNLPSGTRAIALPDNSYNNSSPFLKVFGRPENESVCECERVQGSSLSQSLHLMNAGDVKSKLAMAGGRVDRWIVSNSSAEEIVQELYRIAYCREPSTKELETAMASIDEMRLDKQGNPIEAQRVRRENLQDLVWAIVNTKEFLFNH